MFRLLYSDHGYRRRVESWNAADVRGEDGLLQHGSVIGVGTDGLLVDFGCDGQRRRLVKYGEAFGYYGMDYSADHLRPGCAVEVLLRLDDKSPWVWRPATLLAADICTLWRRSWAVFLTPAEMNLLALVDVQFGGVGRREVVEFGQIRPPSCPAQLHSRVLWRDIFALASIHPLPADVAALLPTHSPLWKIFCQRLSALLTVSPASVSNSEILILYRTKSYFSRIEDPSELVVKEAQCSMEITVTKKGLLWAESGFRCSLPLSCGLAEVQDTAEGTEWNLQNMPHLIVAEMFTYLETMQQASQRRVCRAFNEFLTGTMPVEIRLTYRECGMTGRKFDCSCSRHLEYYPMCAPLLKCVTARTRRITVTHGGPGALSNVLKVLKLCGQLGQYVLGQQMLVVAGQCSVGVGISFWGNANDLATVMTGSWCKLVLKQCTMHGPLDLRLSGSLPRSSLRTLQEDLCQLIEDQLPAFNIQRTREWLSLTVHGQPPECEDIRWDLSEFTSADPRAGSPYAGYSWSQDSIYEWAALDVSKLSRLALFALRRHMPLA